jgi:hypothetical protein
MLAPDGTPNASKDRYGERAAFVTALHAVADWYAYHPDMPVPDLPNIHFVVRAADDAAGTAEIHRIAGILDRHVEVSPSGHVEVAREFGPVVVSAAYVPSDRMRRWYATQSYAGVVDPDEPVVDLGDVLRGALTTPPE